LLDDAELNFPYERLSVFRDLEGDGRVVVNPKSLRERYLERVRAFLERARQDCFERKISYEIVNTRQPYDFFLAQYLDKRRRLG